MIGMSVPARFDRARFASLADALAVAVAVALPWSTTATGVFLTLWLLVLIPTLEWPDVRRELLTTAVGQNGVLAEIADNPHNQSLAVGIQLGLVGVIVLWAMWVAHFATFRAASFVTWIGIVVATQNIVGSLFNSFLFDHTEGWLYAFGFGVVAGMVRHQPAARIGKPDTKPVHRP